MKKVFIGLLIIAAGAAIYYFGLRNVNKPMDHDNITKQGLIGIWKVDSIIYSKKDTGIKNVFKSMADSALKQFRYGFDKEGIVTYYLGDSAVQYKSYYTLDKGRRLIWKEDSKDTTGDITFVNKMSRDSLRIQDSDSTLVLLSKVK